MGLTLPLLVLAVVVVLAILVLIVNMLRTPPRRSDRAFTSERPQPTDHTGSDPSMPFAAGLMTHSLMSGDQNRYKAPSSEHPQAHQPVDGSTHSFDVEIDPSKDPHTGQETGPDSGGGGWLSSFFGSGDTSGSSGSDGGWGDAGGGDGGGGGGDGGGGGGD
ncbi:MAG: hypothetical protein AMXMBFR58_23520 [Phycisphaerae bacterium]